MKVLHISESFNRSSILKEGLLPSKVSLPHHLAVFQEYDMCTPDNRILYTWESCDNDAKYIKDMVFCKVFIQPRNKMPHLTDYSKLLNKFMGSMQQMTYDIYEATVPTQENFFIHGQSPTLNIYDSCFKIPCEFAHNDKPLHLYKKPLKDLRIVGSAEFEYDKNNRYIVRVK